jgi:isoleucyl-tRNA synthetase
MSKRDLRKKALKSIDETVFYPSQGQARLQSMIETRPDWCISRQRSWGVPIPLFTNKETGELHPKTLEIIEKVAIAVEEKGIQAWYDLEAKTLITDHEKFEKSSDILDVWFDSGITHYGVLENRDNLSSPADLYLEGSDQH